MKIYFQLHVLVIVLCVGSIASAQTKYEREHRIRKVQFPEKALEYIEQNLANTKRIRFYKEIDNNEIHFKTKFKKDRLWYAMAFDKTGVMKNVEIVIKSIDIPDEVFAAMNSYLTSNFKKYKIRKIHQRYPVFEKNNMEGIVKSAFQNLILPTIHYELIVTGKKDKRSEQYEVLFDSEGNFRSIRKSLPPNYDHVLY